MGAGISSKDWRKRLYNSLKKFQRQLIKAGVPTLYKNLQLFPDTTGLKDEIAFNITYYSIGPASNGERAARLVVWLQVNAEPIRKWGVDNWNGSEGIPAIIETYTRLRAFAQRDAILATVKDSVTVQVTKPLVVIADRTWEHIVIENAYDERRFISAGEQLKGGYAYIDTAGNFYRRLESLDNNGRHVFEQVSSGDHWTAAEGYFLNTISGENKIQ